jgi:DNA mismatch repair protein MutS
MDPAPAKATVKERVMPASISRPAAGNTVPFHSILFDEPDAALEREQPGYFTDLNLDQVIAAITAGRGEYDLAPFFYTRLRTVEAITYRHEILHDLSGDALSGSIATFARHMRAMREHLRQVTKLHYQRQKQSWFLDAVALYCGAVTTLAGDLARADLRSRGLRAFRDHLADYAGSEAFTALAAETEGLLERLAGIRYCLHIRDSRIRVTRYDAEADYSADVAATFSRFAHGAVKDYRATFHDLADMDHVEAGILDLVARLYPDVFADLDEFCETRGSYLDRTVAAFDREVQFYAAYLEFAGQFRRAGLALCYPQVSGESKDTTACETYDVALAAKLVSAQEPVVCNDFFLRGTERILVVSGPNQGGKTTFARAFGQLHHLASIGVTVPGTQARLLLFDELFTHFERGENLQDLRGKLEDDLTRIHGILGQATASSIVIMNEIFTSTTLQDAVFLGTRVLEQIIDLDLICVCVTFVDELSSLGPSTVSMVSTVAPGNPADRTYKIVRKPADGLAYALAIAEKYRLTYGALRERIAS